MTGDLRNGKARAYSCLHATAQTGMTEFPDTVSTAEAADALGLTPQAIRLRIAKRTMEAVRVGSAWRIPASVLEEARRLSAPEAVSEEGAR